MKYIYLIIILLFVCSNDMKSYDNTKTYYDTVYVVSQMGNQDLNKDGIKDTIMGRYYQENALLPFFIKWGVPSTNLDTTLPKYSTFIYPKFKYIYGSSYFMNLSTDSIPDIFFYVEGVHTNRVIVQSDTSFQRKDTLFAFILFASPSLRRLAYVRLDTLMNGQNPYGLVFQSNIDSNAMYSVTALQRYNIPLLNKIATPFENSQYEPIDSFIIKTYPNPITNTLNIEMEDLPIGEYNIQIFNSSGNIIMTEPLIVNKHNSKIFKELIINSISSGNYMVIVLDKNQQILFERKIIVIK